MIKKFVHRGNHPTELAPPGDGCLGIGCLRLLSTLVTHVAEWRLLPVDRVLAADDNEEGMRRTVRCFCCHWPVGALD